VFIVDIVVPPEYPNKPPLISFDTKIWHPNVNSKNGTVHLDILLHEWSPTLTIKTALLALHSLLKAPNAYDPEDKEAASQYINDIDKFERIAKDWVEDYAIDVSSHH